MSLEYAGIHKKSAHDTPRPKPPGIPSRSLVGANQNHLRVNVNHLQGNSFDCDPRQIGLTLSHGNEFHVDITGIGTPKMFFWESIIYPGKQITADLLDKGGHIRSNPGWVYGRFQGIPGKPTGPISWNIIPDKKVPGSVDGIFSKVSSNFGSERGMENIVAARGDGTDIVVAHISEAADRRLLPINCDDWQKRFPERRDLIKKLDKLPVTDAAMTKVSRDGKTLHLYFELGPNGRLSHEKLDITCLNLGKDRPGIYHDPQDAKLSIKIIVPCERTDFECVERSQVKTFFNPAIQDAPGATVKAYRKTPYYVVKIKPADGSGPTVIRETSLRKVKKHAAFMALEPDAQKELLKALKNAGQSPHQDKWIKAFRSATIVAYQENPDEYLVRIEPKSCPKTLQIRATSIGQVKQHSDFLSLDPATQKSVLEFLEKNKGNPFSNRMIRDAGTAIVKAYQENLDDFVVKIKPANRPEPVQIRTQSIEELNLQPAFATLSQGLREAVIEHLLNQKGSPFRNRMIKSAGTTMVTAHREKPDHVDYVVRIEPKSRPKTLQIRATSIGQVKQHSYFLSLDPATQKSVLEFLEKNKGNPFSAPMIKDAGTAIVKAYQENPDEYLVRIEPKEQPTTVEIKGRTFGQIKSHTAFKSQSSEIRDAILNALEQSLDMDNFEWSRVEKLRKRYVLQYHHFRESRFINALDRPLKTGESLVVTQAKGAAEIVHLDGFNGRERGDREVIPLNFDPTLGKPANLDLVRLDPRPDAINKTRMVDPVATALAGQHLIDLYGMGTEMMSTVWPKVDQLGFFGVFMTAGMAFPYGNEFTDPQNNPWYIRCFGYTSHSIFDSKMDAGTQYYPFSGLPRLGISKMRVGAAMVTGPNTDSVNVAREGRLFHVRIPGMKPHMVKTAIPGFYILVIEDAESSYYETTMYGLVTETTIFPLSAGGGLSNYQLCWTVQRSQRWNAGKDIYLMDAAGEIWKDITNRGRFIYADFNGIFNGVYSNTYSKENIGDRVTLANCARKDAISKTRAVSAQQAVRTGRAFDPNRPGPAKFSFNQLREWTNVGTWYWVSLRQMILYLVAPGMILLGMSFLPAEGALFLLACIAQTLFAWPLWAIQMMKVGISPKGILSMNPYHLFWNDLPMRTMAKSGFDIERAGVGKFRISDRSMGNRLPTKDKRFAFWVAAVLPTAGSAVVLGTAASLALAFGLAPKLVAAAPFLAGYYLGGVLKRWVKRLLPNPGSRSVVRSAVRWAAGSIPMSGGLVASVLI
ncbi:MAG: hypothetical protein WC645_08290, partial [Candidatus Margulisiibacteriota bacterium]